LQQCLDDGQDAFAVEGLTLSQGKLPNRLGKGSLPHEEASQGERGQGKSARIVGDWGIPVKKFRTELIPIGETPPGLLA
jgi:hypothetical protein